MLQSRITYHISDHANMENPNYEISFRNFILLLKKKKTQKSNPKRINKF